MAGGERLGDRGNRKNVIVGDRPLPRDIRIALHLPEDDLAVVDDGDGDPRELEQVEIIPLTSFLKGLLFKARD